MCSPGGRILLGIQATALFCPSYSGAQESPLAIPDLLLFYVFPRHHLW